MCLENGTRDFKREYRAMNHGTFSVDAKGAGKGERLSHDTMIQSLFHPPERTWVRGKELVLPLAKQILNVSKEVVEVVENAIFIQTI